MSAVFFNINFSQEMPSLAVGLIAFAVFEFVRFVQVLMFASCRYDKVSRINAAFGFAPVMQDSFTQRSLRCRSSRCAGEQATGSFRSHVG